jgi:uncharacterized protein with GYD domain
MPRYISLISFTEQGIKSIKDWDKRIGATRERTQTMRAFSESEAARLIKTIGG